MLWQKLKPDPQDFEIRRNNPITQPLLWTSLLAAPPAQHNHNPPPTPTRTCPFRILTNAATSFLEPHSARPSAQSWLRS